MKKDVDVLNRAMEADYASFKSDQVSIEVNKKFFTNLETLAMVNNVSNYSLFLSTLYILLYKYTSKTNLIIKTPFSERISKEFQDVINNFSNDIILNQDIAPNSSYLDFVKSLNEDIINILSNKLFSYEFFDNEEKENASLFDALLFYHESDAKISNISDILNLIKM